MINIHEARKIKEKKSNDGNNKQDFYDSCISEFSCWDLESNIDNAIRFQSEQGCREFDIIVSGNNQQDILTIQIDRYTTKIDVRDLVQAYIDAGCYSEYSTAVPQLGRSEICWVAFRYIFDDVLRPYREDGYSIERYFDDIEIMSHSCCISW